jgi:hypothetical protein
MLCFDGQFKIDGESGDIFFISIYTVSPIKLSSHFKNQCVQLNINPSGSLPIHETFLNRHDWKGRQLIAFRVRNFTVITLMHMALNPFSSLPHSKMNQSERVGRLAINPSYSLANEECLNNSSAAP